MSVKITDSVYKYDEDLGYGKIVQTVMVESAHNRFAPLTAGDYVIALKINDTEYPLTLMEDIGTILLTARFNDTLTIKYISNGVEKSVSTTLYESLFKQIA